MLLLADWVVPVSSAPVADAGVRVAGGLIVEVGPAAELRARAGDEEVKVFPGCGLLPGLVNSHIHLELSAFRGFSRPSSFGRWMLRLLLARRKLDPDDYEASALWGAYECLRCGVTSVGDTAYGGPAVARAAGEAGLRARVYQEVFGLDDEVIPAALERLESTVRLMQKEASGTPLVEAGVSPHAPYTVSARLYREAARFARRAGLRLATHVAESPAEAELLTRGTGAIARAYRAAGLGDRRGWNPPGLRSLPFVAGTGALTPETLVIHAIQLEREDVATLASSGAAVAHCPRSNARLHCGIAPVRELLAAGVPVGLGTDSLASNDSLDMFVEMRAALQDDAGRAAERCATLEAHAGRESFAAAGLLTPEQVLRMSTLDGARALGWDDRAGSLEAGKSADVIAVSLPGTLRGSTSRRADVIPSIVGRCSAADIIMTMVAGTVLFEQGSPRGTPPLGVTSAYQRARDKLEADR